VEIDAASHGGVDDARDLRERAFFAPAASRYKIYVIDEAHMVTTAGFNALLKVVEEPPEHLKFIFATTEPDKVIPTIRSRTHHYPFRLVPPGVLRDYLAELCEREKVPVDPAVLPLVVRAGAGSVRDSLSVLDQLMAGSGAEGLTLPRATALLGYTDAALLDDVIDAFAAHDGAAVFTLVDRVIEAGHDPRRFVADLLDRLRDLVILAAVPDIADTGLIDAPADQLDRMRAQAARFGRAELSRAADLVNTGLTELRGATAPRLQLELICARVLLPGAGPITDSAEARDLHARLDRLERRLAGTAPVDSPNLSARVGPSEAADTPTRQERTEGSAPAPAPPAPAAPHPATPAPAAQTPNVSGRVGPSDAADGPTRRERAEVSPAVAAGAPDITTVRRMWPDILNVVKTRRRFTWMILIDGVQVASLDDNTLVLAFAEEGKRKNFLSSGSDELLSSAIQEVLRVRWRLDAVLDPARATSPTPPPAGPPHAVPAPAQAPTAPPPASTPAAPPPAPRQAVPLVDPSRDDSARVDDESVDDEGLSGRDLLIRELGATVLEEIEHD
jgi:DNA polymerase-3 subunit gamma/tau